MAIIWADFPSGQQGLYGTNESLLTNGVYAQYQASLSRLTSDPDPSIGASGVVIELGDTGAQATRNTLRFVLPSAQTIVGSGTRIWFSALPSSDAARPSYFFRNGSNNNICFISITTTGAIQAWRGPDFSTGVLLGTSAPVIVANAWEHIECKAVIDAVAGSIEVRVNGVPVLVLTGVNTQGSTGSCEQVVWGASTNFFLKDYVIWDGSGSQNNDFLGSCIIRHLLPDSDVTLGGWTTSSGSTGFNLLNDLSDTTFISADDSPPAPAQFTVNNLPPDITSVKALISVTRSRKVDGGDGNLQTGLTGTLTDLGADDPLTTAFTFRWDVSELSPDSGTAWTPLEVDGVKLDIDRTI